MSDEIDMSPCSTHDDFNWTDTGQRCADGGELCTNPSCPCRARLAAESTEDSEAILADEAAERSA